MNTNVYNVVWADDDIDALIVRFEKRFTNNGIHIIGRAHNGEELEQCLGEKKNMVDAVIVDANFNESETDIDDERDTSGLSFTRSHLLKQYSSIPFILFTQRSDEMIAEKYRNIPKFKSEFPRHERWFKKNDEDELMEMFEAIKKETDYRRTDSFRVRNKYAKEFEAASLIEGATKNLERGLLYLYEDNAWKNTQEYFNPARKIVERIKVSCSQMNLLPPHLSLNIMSKIFSGKECGYWLKEPLMEKPLAESLFFFLKITQDGSHDDDDMSLNVDQYVRETKNINLYRTILYIAMDLLLWHKKMFDKYEKNQSRLWDSKFIYIGKARKHPSREKFSVGEYRLDTKDISINDGDMVGILGFNVIETQFGAIKNVYKNNYIILEKAENNSQQCR